LFLFNPGFSYFPYQILIFFKLPIQVFPDEDFFGKKFNPHNIMPLQKFLYLLVIYSGFEKGKKEDYCFSHQ